jgi:hypothetical protein
MTRRFWTQAVGNAAGYVLCVLALKYLAGFAAVQLSNLTYRGFRGLEHFDPSDALNFYARNWLLFNLVSGMAAGFTVYAVWRHYIAIFVWVPSASLLCWKILTHPNSAMDSAWAGARYFLSAGCPDISLEAFHISERCSDQFHYSLPFYAALGFSLGALLSMFYRQHTASLPTKSVFSSKRS